MRDGRLLRFLVSRLYPEDVDRMLQEFGGQPQSLPTIGRYRTEQRDQLIRLQVQLGSSLKDLAAIHGLTVRHLRRILAG